MLKGTLVPTVKVITYFFSEQQAAQPVQQVITIPAPAPSQPGAPQQYSGARYYPSQHQQPVSNHNGNN